MTARVRHMDVLSWLDSLSQDVRYALRQLRRTPGFSLVAIATLALGIGANSAIFSVIRAVLLKPLPFADADRVVLLGETRPGSSSWSGAISAPNYLDWSEQNTVFEHIAAVTGGGATLSGDHLETTFIEGHRVSASYFDVFGLHAALGRTFFPYEEQPGQSHVVVLSHRLWASQFGSDPAIVGRSVRLDGEPHIVIGVMPAATGIDLYDQDLWRPRDLGHQGGALTVDGQTLRNRHDLLPVVAKLKPGVTLETARRQMDTIALRLGQSYPASNKGWGVSVQTFPRPLTKDFRRSLYLLLAAVGMVLLIGCVNIAALALARGNASARDMAIRAAIGAGRGRLVRQCLTENLLIGLSGGLLGLVVGKAVLMVMTGAIPTTGMSRVLSSETVVAMDAPVSLFSLALAMFSGLACGLGPALAATRTSLAGIVKDREAPGITSGRSQKRLRHGLIVAEVALAFVLLSSAGLLIQRFFALQQQVGTGFDSTNVLTAWLPIPQGRLNDADGLNTHYSQIADRIQAFPGVRDVAFADGLPTQGAPLFGQCQRADLPRVERSLRPLCGIKAVSPSYFRAVGLHMLRGRTFDDRDRDGTPFVVVINETFARTHFPAGDPIGKRLFMGAVDSAGAEMAVEIVGVMADEGLSWSAVPEGVLYCALAQNPWNPQALFVRGTVDPTRLQESIRKAVSAFDPEQALADMQSLDQLKTGHIASDRLLSLLLGAFAVIAIALTALGLYGVLSFLVVQRTREIGIRAALGAGRRNLVALVVRQGMIITGWGLALGLCGALLAGRILSTLVFGMGPLNPTTMAVVAAILAGVALVACYLPARRATKVDPLIALRCE